MADSPLLTDDLPDLLERLRSGDPQASHILITAVQDRITSLAERMLRRSPTVRRWIEAEDVRQNVALRLLNSLNSVCPADTRSLHNLAAAQVRRELIDLARHYSGPLGLGANHGSVGGEISDVAGAGADASDLDRWTSLHEAVERLPAEERETFSLIFYQGWTQAQTAVVVGVDERTIRRRWRAACLALSVATGDTLPLS